MRRETRFIPILREEALERTEAKPAGLEAAWDGAEFALMNAEVFRARLIMEGTSHYHNLHPFHHGLYEGGLSHRQLQRWVENRYYYQSRIPIKDALILSKSEDARFRRLWIRRVRDQDGDEDGAGGELAQWLDIAEAVGLERKKTAEGTNVLAGVRFACDAYVELVRQSPLVVGVASSLTEMLAPDLMSARIAALERHYPWVGPEALDYFRGRIMRAQRDGDEGLDVVLQGATTRELQEACVVALIRKTQILWHLLDCVHAAS